SEVGSSTAVGCGSGPQAWRAGLVHRRGARELSTGCDVFRPPVVASASSRPFLAPPADPSAPATGRRAGAVRGRAHPAGGGQVAVSEQGAGAGGAAQRERVPGAREAGAGPRLPRVKGFAGWPAEGSAKADGKALRGRIPRADHARLDLDASRPDAVQAVEESSRGR